jgi:hypothetical protein
MASIVHESGSHDRGRLLVAQLGNGRVVEKVVE